jgi:hypothetical protein
MLIVAGALVVVVGLAIWRQRELSRGAFATTLGRLVMFPASAGSAAMPAAPSLPSVARGDKTASPPGHGVTNRWRSR